jgi:L-alanine-DL-glutamate epimerase-like enolase superfamily enzyme
VGADLESDMRRCRIVREELGPDRKLMVDANQKWDVQQVRSSCAPFFQTLSPVS